MILLLVLLSMHWEITINTSNINSLNTCIHILKQNFCRFLLTCKEFWKQQRWLQAANTQKYNDCMNRYVHQCHKITLKVFSFEWSNMHFSLLRFKSHLGRYANMRVCQFVYRKLVLSFMYFSFLNHPLTLSPYQWEKILTFVVT